MKKLKFPICIPNEILLYVKVPNSTQGSNQNDRPLKKKSSFPNHFIWASFETNKIETEQKKSI